MFLSVRKNVVRSLVVLPLTFSCGFAQSPIGTLTESDPVSALSSQTAQTNNLFVNQWVHVNGAGSISGSVVALLGKDSISLPKMRVSLSVKGSVVAFDDTDIEGEFLIEHVSPGLYTLTAEGASSLAIFSLVVLDENAGKHLPNAINVPAMRTSGRVTEILRGQSIPRTSYPSNTPNQDPLASNRNLASSYQVLLDGQGTLSGRLGRAADAINMSSMTVFIMKDGQEVKRVRVSADGSFSVPGLAPACYGLVAAGDQGVAATGFCAVNTSVVSKNAGGKVFVAQGNKIPTSLNIELGDALGSELPPQNEVVVSEPSIAPSAIGMGPGFGGGGSVGGGSGGGGLGGIGALAAIGGLVAVGIIAADDNNNDAPVVSPVVR